MPNFSMPWVEADFRRKTQHLTRIQREAYRALLQACWDAGGVLPDDDKALARIFSLSLILITSCADACLAPIGASLLLWA